MAPALYHHHTFTLSSAALRTLIQNYASDLSLAYTECEQDVALISTDHLLEGYHPTFRPYLPHLSEMLIEITDWDRGRIFGKEGEIRWSRSHISDGYQVSLLTETDALLSDTWRINDSYPDFDANPAERSVMLIGTRTDRLPVDHARHTDNPTSIWIETRYPRPFTYPVDDNVLSVYLTCVDYAVNGMVTLTRLKAIGGSHAEQ
jgi:hypothetical protein